MGSEPKLSYGERPNTAQDPGGHLWTFRRSVADVVPEDWDGSSARQVVNDGRFHPGGMHDQTYSRAIAFYKAAFGAVEAYRVEDPDGAVVSRLSVEGAEFWLGDEPPEHGNFSPETLNGGTARMILTVPDPDAAFATAVAAGSRAVSAVEDAYGWRVSRILARMVEYRLGAHSMFEIHLRLGEPRRSSSFRTAVSPPTGTTASLARSAC